MKKTLGAILCIAMIGLLSMSVTLEQSNASATFCEPTTEQTSAFYDFQREVYEIQNGGHSFYACMIMCGVPYLVAVAALAFEGDGYGPAEAMIMAGVTAAFIACVLTCMGGGGGGSFDDCPCHLVSNQLEEE